MEKEEGVITLGGSNFTSAVFVIEWILNGTEVRRHRLPSVPPGYSESEPRHRQYG